LPYDTYLDDYSQWNFNIQILIMLVNGAMIFVRIRDEDGVDGEMEQYWCQLYDHICFGCIFAVWLVYQVYAYQIRVPRIIKDEAKKLLGMTDSNFEKVDRRFLEKVTGQRTFSESPSSFLFPGRKSETCRSLVPSNPSMQDAILPRKSPSDFADAEYYLSNDELQDVTPAKTRSLLSSTYSL